MPVSAHAACRQAAHGTAHRLLRAAQRPLAPIRPHTASLIKAKKDAFASFAACAAIARTAGLISDTALGKHLKPSPLQTVCAPTFISSARDSRVHCSLAKPVAGLWRRDLPSNRRNAPYNRSGPDQSAVGGQPRGHLSIRDAQSSVHPLEARVDRTSAYTQLGSNPLAGMP